MQLNINSCTYCLNLRNSIHFNRALISIFIVHVSYQVIETMSMNRTHYPISPARTIIALFSVEFAKKNQSENLRLHLQMIQAWYPFEKEKHQTS